MIYFFVFPTARENAFLPSTTQLSYHFQLKMFNKIAIASAAVAAVGLARADDSYGSPLAPAYGAPAASYGAPAASYGAPAPSYSAPAPAYGAPAEEYSASPDTSYNAPSYGAGEAELDLTPIIIGILVLTGLSLLFPTYVSLSTVRRKRSAGTQGKLQDLLLATQYISV